MRNISLVIVVFCLAFSQFAVAVELTPDALAEAAKEAADNLVATGDATADALMDSSATGSVMATGKAPNMNKPDEDRVAALNDARRKAIEQVLGIMIDSRIRLENELLVQDTVISKTTGYITNETIISEGYDFQGYFYEVTISCDVSERDIAADVDRMKKSIIVLFNENISGTPSTKPIVEGAVRQALVDAGHKCLAEDFIEDDDDISSGDVIDVGDLRELGRKYLAQVVVYGTIDVDEGAVISGDIGYVENNPLEGMKTADAVVNIKAVDTSTGKIIAERQSTPQEFRGAGNNLDRAIAQALYGVTDVYPKYFATKLKDINPNAESSFTLTVLGVPGFSIYSQLSRTFSGTYGVVECEGDLEGEVAVFDLTYNGEAEDFGISLENISNPHLRITKFSSDSIECEVVGY